MFISLITNYVLIALILSQLFNIKSIFNSFRNYIQYYFRVVYLFVCINFRVNKEPGETCFRFGLQLLSNDKRCVGSFLHSVSLFIDPFAAAAMC